MKEISLKQTEKVAGGLAPFAIMILAMAVATLFGASDGEAGKEWNFPI
jgi:hypothetical protein